MKHDDRMAKERLWKLMLSLALPSIIAQLINILYNIIDRIFIGHIAEVGDVALTGVGVAFPIVTIVAAFSAIVGAGGAPLAAIQLGRKNNSEAEKILGNGVFLLALFSIILTISFQIFKTPLLYMFGASETTIQYGRDYLSIYLVGTIFVQLSLGLNAYISCQGKAKTAMFSILIGAVLNILLDPLFIYVLGMGVKGAALATVISQAASATWIISFLTSERTTIKIRIKNIRPALNVLKNIVTLGISPFVMQSTESLIMIVLNIGLMKYGGDLYVGSMTIMQSVMQLIFVPVSGFSQGVQPIVSYNYGAQNFERVKKTAKVMILTAFSVACIMSLIIISFPGFFASWFTKEEELIGIVRQNLPVFIAGMTIFGIQNGCQGVFVGLGQRKISLFLAVLRKLILLIPLALVLPVFMGVRGIYFAEPIADSISALTAGSIYLFTYKKILTKTALEKNNGGK